MFHINFKNIQRFIIEKNINTIVATTPFYVTKNTWDFIYGRSIDTVAWFGDNPLWKQGMLEGIDRYKAVFVPDEEWARPIRYLNAKTEYLPHAADPKVFYPIAEMKKHPEVDVLFVAHAYPGTGDGLLRAEIANALVEAGISLAIYGGDDWNGYLKKFPKLQRVFHRGIVSSEKLNELYNSSKIVLNVHHTQLFSGTNQRTFEAAASGAFQLADYKRGVVEIVGDDWALFRTIPEMVEKVRYFLQHESERIQYAEKIQQKILSSHTYEDRANTLLNVF